MKRIYVMTFLLLPFLVQAQKLTLVTKKEWNISPGSVQDFKIERLSRSHVLLTWHTATLLNCNGFELERKLGMDGDFSSLGFIPLKNSGNNSDIMDYQFNDPNNFSGTSFYRLKQKDSNGRIYYSMALKVVGMGK